MCGAMGPMNRLVKSAELISAVGTDTADGKEIADTRGQKSGGYYGSSFVKFRLQRLNCSSHKTSIGDSYLEYNVTAHRVSSPHFQ
ncbi:hypothetical protein MJO28_003578 [Puccinia striiformis f. sp. tritici]|uniref:Uncharacterized protein n=1 Tax=Puccinia striiformis f. sp. tritici TaxID=168172 RepID=A0ACC0ENN2_9BASI|nr:hypothetical protein MJO28_003578 [Puccinia striiformis f. sp. tritici]